MSQTGKFNKMGECGVDKLIVIKLIFEFMI
jgi:hypothetical protein